MYKVTLKIANQEFNKIVQTKEEAEEFRWELGWDLHHDGETDYEIVISKEEK